MTPIASSFEDRLLDALLDRFDTTAHQPTSPPASPTPGQHPTRRRSRGVPGGRGRLDNGA